MLNLSPGNMLSLARYSVGIMTQKAWRDVLRKYFEDVRMIEKAKVETIKSFEQFCEFIAEPAFDSLEEEMKEYGVKVSCRKEKGRAFHFNISFRIENR